MEITRENTGELSATVKMVISPADYSEKVNKILKDYQHKANVPGFRPGHVPFGMIKKLYGSTIFAEEVNKLVSENLNNYLTDENLRIIGQPLPNTALTPLFDWKDEQDIEFFFDLGLSPSFEVVLDENIAIDYHLIKADDHMVEKYITDMRKRNGKTINSETAGENDVLSGDFKELDNEGNVKEGGITHLAKIAIDMISDKEVNQKLIGTRIGDIVIFNPLKATGNAAETASMLGITKKEAENLESDFLFTVNEISAIVPAEMDTDFFNTVFPDTGISSEDEFRKKVSLEFKISFIPDSDHLFSHHVQEKLTQTISIPLPDNFIKRLLLETNEGRLSQEQVEKDYDKYAMGMRWELIENMIIKEADIHVEDQEVKDIVKDHYLQGWRTMPLDEEFSNRLDAIAEKFIKDKPSEAGRILDSLYQQRLIAYVKTKVKLVEKEISYDEFLKIDAEKHR